MFFHVEVYALLNNYCYITSFDCLLEGSANWNACHLYHGYTGISCNKNGIPGSADYIMKHLFEQMTGLFNSMAVDVSKYEWVIGSTWWCIKHEEVYLLCK